MHIYILAVPVSIPRHVEIYRIIHLLHLLIGFRHPFVALPPGRNIPALMTEGFASTSPPLAARASPGYGREGDRPSSRDILGRNSLIKEVGSGQEAASSQQDVGDGPDLAAMVMGHASSSKTQLGGKQRAAGTHTAPAPDLGRGVLEEAVDFSSQPQLFKVRGLLGIPPLRTLGEYEAPPLVQFSIQSQKQ